MLHIAPYSNLVTLEAGVDDKADPNQAGGDRGPEGSQLVGAGLNLSNVAQRRRSDMSMHALDVVSTQVQSLQRIEPRVESAAQKAKDKSETKVDSVEEWQSMLEDEIYPVMNLADNDLKDACRRINGIKAKERKTKDRKDGTAAAAAGSDDDDGGSDAD